MWFVLGGRASLARDASPRNRSLDKNNTRREHHIFAKMISTIEKLFDKE